MEKIKEKPARSERIKEKVVSAPKELLHKGLDDGAERLRTQLRDTARQGRRDEYGGDDIEDIAVGGSKRAAAELLKQRKQKTTEQPSDPARNSASAPDARRNESPIIRTKDTEFVENQTPAAAPQTQARRAAMQKAAAVKTKDTYIETQAKTSVTAAPEPQRQGQRAFVREQGRKAMRQTRLRQTERNRRLRNTSPGLGTSETISTAQNAEDLSRKSIKERTSIPFPKASQKALLKKDGQAEHSVQKIRVASRGIGRLTDQTTRAAAQSAAARGAVQSAKEAAAQAARYQQTAKAAQTAVQKTAQAAGRALRAILAAARSLLAAMMAGGSTVVSMVLVICLIGLLIASPFGIFFSGEDSGTGYTMPEAVRTLNGEFTDRIEQIKAENPYDELDMDNAGSAAMIANWRDVLAIYAVRTTTDDTSPDEVATLTEEKLDILRQIFWDMNAISYWVETVSGDEDESDTVILHITVTVKDHLQMADEYRFNTEQRKLLEELMQPEYQELFMVLTGSYQDIDLSPEEIQEIINKLPTDLSEERKQVVLTAYQLLGKVNYFWGGKSLVLGWDSRWGTPMEVTAAGSSSSGTVRPFGLDCSGFVDWVFYNQSGGSYIIGHGGGASAQHSYCTPISWSDAKPGDLVFYPGDSHVGIVCGFDSSGNILIIHCASSENNVVVTGKSGFTSIGRPEYFAD